MFPTQEQIVARIEQRKEHDFLGFEVGNYLSALDFEHAKPFLKEEATAEGWAEFHVIKSPEDAIKAIRDYMPFAWGKANNCRGISAQRSVAHFVAWCWLTGDVEFSVELELSSETRYMFYGKPQLVLVAEKYDVDWRALDNDRWTNEEGSPGVTAEEALRTAHHR